MYNKASVDRKEINLFIAKGVHVEVILGKRVDWSTLKGLYEKNVQVPIPKHDFIGPARLYPNGGLERFGRSFNLLRFFHWISQVQIQNSMELKTDLK